MLPRRERPAHAVAALRLALAAAALIGLALPAAARDFAVATQGRLLSMELAGHLVSVPGPLWGAGDQPVETEKSQIVYQEVAPGVESVLFLPTDESVVHWTHMMGVLAVGRPGYTAELQIKSMVDPMAESCVAGQAALSPIPASAAGERPAVLLLCGRYEPRGSGPRSCVAGILVGVAVESTEGAMKVYQEWCTGAYDVRDRNAWPVGDDELHRRAAELQQATSFIPLDILERRPEPSILGGWWS